MSFLALLSKLLICIPRPLCAKPFMWCYNVSKWLRKWLKLPSSLLSVIGRLPSLYMPWAHISCSESSPAAKHWARLISPRNYGANLVSCWVWRKMRLTNMMIWTKAGYCACLLKKLVVPNLYKYFFRVTALMWCLGWISKSKSVYGRTCRWSAVTGEPEKQRTPIPDPA